MLVVGLTGGFGAGKSTAADLLRRHGAVVIDTDAITHELLSPGGAAVAPVLARFTCAHPNGGVDREVLAKLVFTDSQARSDLERIVHPLVFEELARRLSELSEQAIVVVQVPLLVETGVSYYDMVITVEADDDVRSERLRAHGWNDEAIERRSQALSSAEARSHVADRVLLNNTSQAELASQVDDLWDDLQVLQIEKQN